MSDGIAAMKFAIPYSDGSGTEVAVFFDQLNGYSQGYVVVSACDDVRIPFERMEWFCESLLHIRTTLIAEGYLPSPTSEITRLSTKE